jgi:NTP pyrophosphatase (non-canonical NTP hydrolase)
MPETLHFNGLTEAEAERLALLSEECAEVIQAIAKIQRHGYESHNPTIAVPDDERPETNRMRLEKELGDVICAMRKLRHAGDVSESQIDEYADEKARKVRRWLHHTK